MNDSKNDTNSKHNLGNKEEDEVDKG